MPEEAEKQNKGRLRQARNAAARVESTGRESYKAVSEAGKHKWKAPYEAVKLAVKLRKKINDHDNTPFLILMIAAIICDLIEIGAVGMGGIATFSIKLFIFIMLWGRGTWKIKLVFRIMASLDMIPILDFLPLSTIAVIYVWHHITKEATKAKEDEVKLGEKLSLAQNR